MSLSCGATAMGQEQNGNEQMLVDADALIVGTEVTTRCAVFDSSFDYLTPLEQVGATLRLEEILVRAADSFENVPDRVARMHAEAADMECGSDALIPFMDFSRQIARDMIDIAMIAWRSIDIEKCNYFADNDFLDAAERARAVAQAASIEGEANRIAYIEQRGAAWVQLFAQNCSNLQFNPVETVPGQIALALPIQ